jgi:hypothetical protein
MVHTTRERVRASTNVALAAPVDPAYVVPMVIAPMAVKFAVVPNVRPVEPETASIALDTEAPVPNLASIVAGAPASVYWTWTVAPSTHEYTVEPGTMDAVHVVGTLTTKITGDTSGEVYPSGAVTTTAKRTEPEAGALLPSV